MIRQDSSKSEDEGILIVCSDPSSAPLARPDTFSDDIPEMISPQTPGTKTLCISTQSSGNHVIHACDAEVSEHDSLLPPPPHSKTVSDWSLRSSNNSSRESLVHDELMEHGEYYMLEFAEKHYNVHITSSGYGAVVLKTFGMTRRRSTSVSIFKCIHFCYSDSEMCWAFYAMVFDLQNLSKFENR